jgi:hypothetical protein
MKYSIIMILLLILSINKIFSQDYEPQENIVFTFTENNVTTTFTVSATSQNYEQQGFLLGWHWRYAKRMSEALEIYPYLPIPLLAYLRDFLRKEYVIG